MLQYLPMVSSLAQGAGSLMDLFGVGKPKQRVAAPEGERLATSLLMALNDPNNSLVQQESQSHLQKGMNDILTVLKQQQMMDARRMGRGLRGTFYSPERADEAMSYLTSRALPNLSYAANQTARNDIRQRANDFLSLGGNQNTRNLQNMMLRNDAYSKFQGAGGYGGALSSGVQGIGKLLGMFGVQ